MKYEEMTKEKRRHISVNGENADDILDFLGSESESGESDQVTRQKFQKKKESLEA